MNESSATGDNEDFRSTCNHAVRDNTFFNTFKGRYGFHRGMGRIPHQIGQTYGDYVKNNYPDIWEQREKIQCNDRIGDSRGKVIHSYDFGVYSPNTLKYLRVYSDLTKHFGDLSKRHIVEIGGGYGGQAVVTNALSGFGSWIHIDLPAPLSLQKRYTESLGVKCSFIPYESGWKDKLPKLLDTFDIVISTHAFCTMKRTTQEEYMNNVLLKSANGYLLNSRHSEWVPYETPKNEWGKEHPYLNPLIHDVGQYTETELNNLLPNASSCPDEVYSLDKHNRLIASRYDAHGHSSKRTDYIVKWRNKL